LAAAQTRDKSAVNAEQLKDICKKLKEKNDFVLVDCPAGIEQGFQNAVAGASEAIVVTTPEMSAIRDADRIIGLLNTKEEIKSTKLLLNRVRPNLIRTNEMMSVDDVVGVLEIPLIGIIPEDTGIITSTNKGEPIVNDEKSLAGEAYRRVAKRVLGEEVPFLDLDEPKGLMAKIKNAFAKLKAKV
jgi:septum site-determining protein MinD